MAHALRTMTRDFAGLVVTTGGTGFGPRDLTPEGTRAVIEREAPGLVEAIRRVSDDGGRGFGMLSRAVAGTLGACLIVNTPGQRRAARSRPRGDPAPSPPTPSICSPAAARTEPLDPTVHRGRAAHTK